MDGQEHVGRRVDRDPPGNLCTSGRRGGKRQALRAAWGVLAILLASALFGPPASGEEIRRIVLIVIDGLDARRTNPLTAREMLRLAEDGGTRFVDARAVMPAVTNTNHVSLVTGARAGAHGIVGNWFRDREDDFDAKEMDEERWIDVPTAFDALAGHSLGVFGKGKLASLLDPKNGALIWSDPGKTEGSDARVAARLRGALVPGGPRFLLANLAEVDQTSHGKGPDTAAARRAIRDADRLVGGIATHLKEDGLWDDTLLVVTSDHGFADVAPSDDRPRPIVAIAPILRREGFDGHPSVSAGGLAYVYVPKLELAGTSWSRPDALHLELLETALRTDDRIAWVGALPPTPTSPPSGRDDPYSPPWGLDHARAGRIVVAAKPGYNMSESGPSWLRGLAGNHGGPDTASIPLIVSGGANPLPPGTQESTVDAADVGATILCALGLPSGRETLPGSPERWWGRVLPGFPADRHCPPAP